ncbi:hypothetical protein M422DRAFT_65696 [Sphaerobolus stellatus SS14]|nr:hypothetical protein M422DRAFT_65696 [Sphaerobolus stellatus SS14]
MLVTYAARKVMAEKAAFDFIEKEKLATILPATSLGSVFHGKPSGTPGIIYSTLQNDISRKDFILSQWTVDVRDVAKLHYFGLAKEEMVGKRWFGASNPWGPNDILAIIRKTFPVKAIPDDFEGGEGTNSNTIISLQLPFWVESGTAWAERPRYSREPQG